MRADTKGKHEMGKRFAILIGVAALGAAVIAAGASADSRSVGDPRGDTKCFHERGRHQPCSDSNRRNADIVRATAGHDGTRLRHTIRVVGKIERPSLVFNTDSDPECEWILHADRGEGKSPKLRECFTGRRGGPARVDFHLHAVEIFFNSRAIGDPDGYGWHAGTNAGPAAAHANDQLPKQNRYIQHPLG